MVRLHTIPVRQDLSIAMSLTMSPWTSSLEWDDVFELLYSSETDNRRKGVSRVGLNNYVVVSERVVCFGTQVAAWKARGAVPALLEVTADIVSLSGARGGV